MNKRITDIVLAQHRDVSEALQSSAEEGNMLRLAFGVAGGLIIDLIDEGILAKGPNWEEE